MLLESVGWIATAVFVSSYFCTRPVTLRRVQMVGAGIWIVYGVIIHAIPVVAANVLVLGAAAVSSRAQRQVAATKSTSTSSRSALDAPPVTTTRSVRSGIRG